MPTCALSIHKTTEPKREYNIARARGVNATNVSCVYQKVILNERLLRFGTAISLPTSIEVGEEESKYITVLLEISKRVVIAKKTENQIKQQQHVDQATREAV